MSRNIDINPETDQALESLPFAVMRRTWQPVALVNEVSVGVIRSVTLLDVRLAIWRGASGKVGAVLDRCPHRGARFGIGQVCGDDLVCPYHGWQFDGRGSCTTVPSMGAAKPPAGFAVTAFSTMERYGFIWVLLEGPALAPIPEVAEFEDATWTYVTPPAMGFSCGFRREIENYLDMSHFAFAHRSSLGTAAAKLIENIDIHTHADGFRMEAPFPALVGATVTSRLQSGHHRMQRCYLPNFTTIRQTWSDGHSRVLLHVPSPMTETTCRVFWSLAISPGFDGPAPAAQAAFAVGVLDEDRRMCENQEPAEVPVGADPGRLVAADRLAITFRRMFKAFCLAQAPSERNESSML